MCGLMNLSNCLKVKSESISCVWLCDPMDCSLPGSCAHGIFQTRILKWVAIPFSRGSSWPRDRTQVSCIAGRCFAIWATITTTKISCKIVPPPQKVSSCVFVVDLPWITALGNPWSAVTVALPFSRISYKSDQHNVVNFSLKFWWFIYVMVYINASFLLTADS